MSVPDILPVGTELPPEQRFAHGLNDYQQCPAITATELAMLRAMNMITDKPSWHEDVYVESIVLRWKDELKHEALLTQRAWDWCVEELKDKALEFQDKHYVRVIDAGSCACKSDDLVITDSLKKHSRPIDPHLYPLVYGQSRIRMNGSIRLADDMLKELLALGETEIVEAPARPPSDNDVQSELERSGVNELYPSLSMWDESHHWSWKYQLLPCEVEIQPDSKARIVSYINNLSPAHPLYHDIEQIVTASIEPWNEVLVHGLEWPKYRGLRHVRAGDQTQQGRTPLRIIAYGAVWKNALTLAQMGNDPSWKARMEAYKWAKVQKKTWCDEYTTVLGQSMSAGAIYVRYKWFDALPDIPASDDVHEGPTVWEHPQPGSYKDWKDGIHKPVVKMISQPYNFGQQQGKFGQKFAGPYHERSTVKLGDRLQVIVSVQTIRAPYVGRWQPAGMLNEHVVASSIYIHGSKNAAAKISFRQETPMHRDLYRYEAKRGPKICKADEPTDFLLRECDHRTEVKILAQVFGFGSVVDLDACLEQTVIRYQETGHIRLPEGRLVTFPNTVEHRLELEAIDESPAYISFVKLDLVDPNYRIWSTRDVLPQQQDWWTDILRGILMSRKLPYELADRIVQVATWPMTMEEALQHKAAYEQELERSRLVRYSQIGSYHF